MVIWYLMLESIMLTACPYMIRWGWGLIDCLRLEWMHCNGSQPVSRDRSYIFYFIFFLHVENHWTCIIASVSCLGNLMQTPATFGPHIVTAHITRKFICQFKIFATGSQPWWLMSLHLALRKYRVGHYRLVFQKLFGGTGTCIRHPSYQFFKGPATVQQT